jgi:ABC-type transport system involved in multi-copper enzyme maturation permease subunit
MTRVLLRKELRDLLPWAILSVCIGLTDLAGLLLRPFDMLPLGVTHRMLGDENGPVLWFMAFAIGTGLGIREQDDGTLAFLDGLPVSRSRVFFVKMAVTFALLCFAPLVASSSALLAHATAHGSLDADYRLDFVFTSF